MVDLGSLWGILTIVGPIVLLAAIAWAMLHNRGSRRDIAHTEQATRENYDRQNREDQAREVQ